MLVSDLSGSLKFLPAVGKRGAAAASAFRFTHCDLSTPVSDLEIALGPADPHPCPGPGGHLRAGQVRGIGVHHRRAGRMRRRGRGWPEAARPPRPPPPEFPGRLRNPFRLAPGSAIRPRARSVTKARL